MTDSRPPGRVDLSKLTSTVEDLAGAVVTVGRALDRLTPIANAASTAALLDYLLQRAIIPRLPGMNRAIEKSFFGDRGILSTFSAKIDMARALDVIDASTHREITLLRKIRNALSHSQVKLTFNDEPIRSLFNEMKKPTGSPSDPSAAFLVCAEEIRAAIERKVPAVDR